MKRNISAVLLILLFAFVVTVGAEDRFGVSVYPGAGYDDATSKQLKDRMQVEAACFQTNDGLADVVAFYKKQTGLRPVGEPTSEGAMFKNDTVDVTIQNPWMDMKSGKMIHKTLISIVKHPE